MAQIYTSFHWLVHKPNAQETWLTHTLTQTSFSCVGREFNKRENVCDVMGLGVCYSSMLDAEIEMSDAE